MFVTPITPWIFSRVYYKLGHKTTLCKVTTVKIASNTFSHHSDMKLEIKHKKKKKKKKKPLPNTYTLTHMEVKQYGLQNKLVTKEIKEEKRKNLETIENRDSRIQKPTGCSKVRSKTEFYSDTSLYEEKNLK